MDYVKEYLLNAEVAFSNKQYNEALTWYQKVLEKTPDDLYALSKAGAICVPLGKFEEALKYFEHAKELDPNNGDNAFNYANACFFNKDNVSAFSAYVEAEKIGCSEDVIPRLYYQLALLCSMRQDVKSALVYFKKCEEADRGGMISLNPDLISEKMKLYMVTQDYANAGKCAAELVAIQPTQFRNYMIYFSIVMANKDFDKAEKVMKDAQSYAETSADDNVTILLQLAAINVARAENDTKNRDRHFEQAINILEKQINVAMLSSGQMVNVLLTLAEVYLKAREYLKSIKCLQFILNGRVTLQPEVDDKGKDNVDELTPEEIEAMMQADMEMIQEKIDTGELSADLGLYAEMEYDEDGNLVPKYDETMFSLLNNFDGAESETLVEEQNNSGTFDITVDIREKVYFTFLSCYLAMDDFRSAEKYAIALRYSGNKYYSYYGVYTCAMISGKLKMNDADKKYAEAIAFFRNKSFADHSDVMAVLFRARLYAEQGKYEKTKELALLLAESDQKSLMDYIEKCKR